MTWIPFEAQDMLEVDITSGGTQGRYELNARCMTSRVGDIARFCYYVGTNIIWVASPADDDGVPIYPEVNSEGATRCDKIRVITDDPGVIRETEEGILADLDEYVRSKKALSDMIPAETLVI